MGMMRIIVKSRQRYGQDHVMGNQCVGSMQSTSEKMPSIHYSGLDWTDEILVSSTCAENSLRNASIGKKNHLWWHYNQEADALSSASSKHVNRKRSCARSCDLKASGIKFSENLVQTILFDAEESMLPYEIKVDPYGQLQDDIHGARLDQISSLHLIDGHKKCLVQRPFPCDSTMSRNNNPFEETPGPAPIPPLPQSANPTNPRKLLPLPRAHGAAMTCALAKKVRHLRRLPPLSGTSEEPPTSQPIDQPRDREASLTIEPRA
jgi:hypothetical protein